MQQRPLKKGADERMRGGGFSENLPAAQKACADPLFQRG